VRTPKQTCLSSSSVRGSSRDRKSCADALCGRASLQPDSFVTHGHKHLKAWSHHAPTQPLAKPMQWKARNASFGAFDTHVSVLAVCLPSPPIPIRRRRGSGEHLIAVSGSEASPLLAPSMIPSQAPSDSPSQAPSVAPGLPLAHNPIASRPKPP